MKVQAQPHILKWVINLDSNFSLGDRLREVRQHNGLSQEQTANIAEITPAYLGQIERGQKNVSINKLTKICAALNISLADFFSNATSQPYNGVDDISNQILNQLNGKSESEKQAVLRLIKLVFEVQQMKP